jgi:hypothetical protein
LSYIGGMKLVLASVPLSFALLSGCATFAPPSSVVRVPTANPAQFAYEFARLAGDDFPRALQEARRECGRKRVHLVSVGTKAPDRGWVVVQCV